MIRQFKYWLCHKLCKELVFNSDMSLEIDRLTILVEEQEEELNKLREMIND